MTADMIQDTAGGLAGELEIYAFGGTRSCGLPGGERRAQLEDCRFRGLRRQPDETDMLLRDSNTGNFELYDIQRNQVAGASSLDNGGLAWHSLGVDGPLAPGNQLV